MLKVYTRSSYSGRFMTDLAINPCQNELDKLDAFRQDLGFFSDAIQANAPPPSMIAQLPKCAFTSLPLSILNV